MCENNAGNNAAEICGICLESMNHADQGELLPCRHRYHISCIRKWHLHSNDFKCPTCRKESKTLHRKHDNIEIDLKYWCNVSLIEQFAKLQLLNQEENEEINDAEEDANEGSEDDTKDEEHEPEGLLEAEGPLQHACEGQGIEILQCALCGEMDDSVTLYCETCETLFHPSCLSELLCEVGEKDSNCTECYGTLSRLRGNKPSSMVIRDSNVRIYDGRMRDKRSILTECIYNRFTPTYTVSYEDKCRIQEYVRTELDSFYHRGSISKSRYITINKHVSRKLYGLSLDGFDPVRINYREQARLSIKEFM
ncbi:unnamed protein product [Kluyveromyces dobzhanskii CBS 2104]|uniref:WGS project CCBQ000000000 data, contig 00097 n=1 Tax=Kluyveromyces dobzhanskii CBS 2104 TaxID=1427455 RepID=A0A0A8L503_9SACH|nr:unnamed protein product [Kluyveromyces dobzhanskii CBS 2104]